MESLRARVDDRAASRAEGARTGTYRPGVDLPVRLWSKVSRGDLATFLLAGVEAPAFVREMPRITS